jgi:hypothetical protein
LAEVAPAFVDERAVDAGENNSNVA